jgi:hypothetical protein
MTQRIVCKSSTDCYIQFSDVSAMKSINVATGRIKQALLWKNSQLVGEEYSKALLSILSVVNFLAGK